MTFYPNVEVTPGSKRCINLKAIRRSIGKRRNPAGKIPYVDLLGSSTKVAHSLREGWENSVMYLAPAKVAGGTSMCIWAGKCQLGCLATSGQLGMGPAQRAIIIKTLGYKADQDLFLQLLVMNVVKFVNGLPNKEKKYKSKYNSKGKLKKDGPELPESAVLKACVRFNGTSDVTWETMPVTVTPELLNSIRIGPKTEAHRYIDKNIKVGKTYRNIYQMFPRLQFYDYTKAPISVRHRLYAQKYKNAAWPKNYHLTYSLDEQTNSPKHAKWALDHGHPVATVFNTDVDGVAAWSDPKTAKKLRAKGKSPYPYDLIPKKMFIPEIGTYGVTNADFTDLRFLDKKDKGKGRIAWLSAKGDAICDTTGFIRDYATGEPVVRPQQWVKYHGRGRRCPIKRKDSRHASTVPYQTWEQALVTGRPYITDKGKKRTKTTILPWKFISGYVSGGKCMRLPTLKQTRLDVTGDSPKLEKIDDFEFALLLREGAKSHGLSLFIEGPGIYVTSRRSRSTCPTPKKEAGSLVRNPAKSKYIVKKKRSGKLTTRRKGATTMAKRRKKLTAAHRRKISLGVKRALRGKRKPAKRKTAKKSTAKRKKCAPKAPKGKPKGTHFKRKGRWYVVGPNRTVRKSSASAANKAKARNRKRGAAKRRRR